MKKLITLAAAGVFALGISTAMAQEGSISATETITATKTLNVDLAYTDQATLDLTKTQTKTVTEDITVTKDIDIEAAQLVTPTNSAQAQTMKKDINELNNVTEEPVLPENSALPAVVTKQTATIDAGSFNGATGVVGVNQAPGSLNNQGNTAAVAYTQSTGTAILGSSASAEKLNDQNFVSADLSTRTDLITGSFTGVIGIIGVNQASGNINNQDNAASMAVGSTSVLAISEADLGLVNGGNTATYLATTRTDTLTGVFGTAAGIVGVNQSSGDMNNQANVASISILTSRAAF